MEVLYKSNKLEKQCSDEREMRRRWPTLVKKLRLRIKALDAVLTVGDLPTDDPGGRWHELKGDRAGTWAGDVSGNWRVIIEPSPNKLHATTVTVLDVEDYHRA